MRPWEYMAVKLYEFGSEEAEMKRPNEYWVSDYGVLPLLQELGDQGWEVACSVGKDLILKREADTDRSNRAVAEVHRASGRMAG